MSEMTPTRSALLEMRDERQAMRESYQFLDEKRLLLAAEMLTELRSYEQAMSVFDGQWIDARRALRLAVARHGLDGLQVYPAVPLGQAGLRIATRQLLGVRLIDASLSGARGDTVPGVYPSPEAEHCRDVFLDLLRQTATLAALAGNLERLRLEYLRTERRARALEEVLMPELEAQIADLDLRLEETDQEEMLRVRHA